MQVQYGEQNDIEAWMKLVQEISWNFPGLETFYLFERMTLKDLHESIV